LSYPKSLRKLISKWIKIPYKNELQSTFDQLIFQDYYDLDYLYPTYKRLYPIAPLHKSLNIEFEDVAKQIARDSVVFQTEGFAYPYLAKVGLMEMQTFVTNSQLSAIFNASKAHHKMLGYPFLDSKLQRYLLHLPDEQKLKLRQEFRQKNKGDYRPNFLLNAIDDSTQTQILNQFQDRFFVNGQFKVELSSRFVNLATEKRNALLESILLLELWLVENKIHD
jgi:hypothetical protein